MTEITPKEMVEWLDVELGLAQSRGPWTDRTQEDEIPFYRLRAIRDFIAKHSDPSMVLVPREPAEELLHKARCTRRDYEAMIQSAKED